MKTPKKITSFRQQTNLLSFWLTKGDFSSVQSLSCVRLFATPWTAACQPSLSITNSQSLLKLMCIESVMPFNHLILCCPLLPPSLFPSIRVFSNESALHIRWRKYWSFSFSISPSNEYSGLLSFRMDWLDLLAVQGLSRVFSNTTVQKQDRKSTRLNSSHHSISYAVFCLKKKKKQNAKGLKKSKTLRKRLRTRNRKSR